MPWSPGEAEKHKKGLNSKQKSKWAAIANSVLKRGGNEASAIRQASGATKQPGVHAAAAKLKLKNQLGGGK